MNDRDISMLLDSMLLGSLIVTFLLTSVFVSIKIKDYYESRKR